jgi:CheY-like chemotaxis protein
MTYLPKVLLVDDEHSIRHLFRRILEKNGYQVDEALDGQQAQQRYLAGPYDLLITDLDMPGMNGWELVSWLLDNFPAARFLVVSGSSSQIPSAWPCLTKPVPASVLVAKVRSLLG